MITVAAVISVLVMLGSGIRPSELDWSELWPFIAIGAVVPGAGGVLFVYAIRAAGTSRVAIVMGVAPLASAVIAVAAFGERPGVALVAGTVLIVLGAISLAWERQRPEGFRIVGLLLAALLAVMFGLRDNLVRFVSEGRDPPSLAATAAALLGGTLALLLYAAVRHRAQLTTGLGHTAMAFLPAGAAIALAYVVLVAALDRGLVTVVAPLTATQSLWAVLLAALIYRGSDALGARLIAAALLIVGGSAIVGALQ